MQIVSNIIVSFPQYDMPYRKTSIKCLAPIKRRSQIDAEGLGGRVSINAGSLINAGFC